MSPYLITMIVFGVVLGAVWLVVGGERPIYLPTIEGAQETPEARKQRAQKIRSKRIVFGVGGTVGLCLLTMLGIWLAGPVTKVYAALNPTATPTVTNTAVATATPTVTRTPLPSSTPTVTATSRMLGTLQAMSSQTAGAPGFGTKTATRTPSSSTGGSITIIRTVIVPQTVVKTQIVQVQVTQLVYVYVIVTATPEFTATATPTASETPTGTQTPSETPTATQTASETPTPTQTSSETPTETPTSTFTPTETPIP